MPMSNKKRKSLPAIEICVNFMTMDNFIETFEQALIAENLDKKAFCVRHGIHQAEVSRFVKHRVFSRAIEDCIFTKWKDPSISIALYLNYFQDIIDAAGHPIVVKFEPK